MAQSRPIIPEACKHENSKPVVVSPDTIRQLSKSWNKIQKSGLLEAGVALYKRLNIEASPDELQQMEQYFTNTVQHPMEEHCCLIINTLDDIIVNKLNCASCIRDGIKKISDTHCSHELFNNSDLYKPLKASLRWLLEDTLKEAFSLPVKSAWEEFIACLRSMLDEMTV